MVAPAIIIEKLAPNWLFNTDKAKGAVRMELVWITIKGQTKEFHCDRNVKIARVASAGLIRGKMIRR